jgi:hypothetical protein
LELKNFFTENGFEDLLEDSLFKGTSIEDLSFIENSDIEQLDIPIIRQRRLKKIISEKKEQKNLSKDFSNLGISDSQIELKIVTTNPQKNSSFSVIQEIGGKRTPINFFSTSYQLDSEIFSNLKLEMKKNVDLLLKVYLDQNDMNEIKHSSRTF